MSEVQTVEVTVKVTKETSEVFAAVAKIIEDVRSGKAITEIALGNLSSLKDAVEGFDQLDDEAKSAQFPETLALGAAKVTKALFTKKVVA